MIHKMFTELLVDKNLKDGPEVSFLGRDNLFYYEMCTELNPLIKSEKKLKKSIGEGKKETHENHKNVSFEDILNWFTFFQ